MIVKRVTRSGDRNAQAATELALVLPLLLTIVLGCIDLGRFAYAATAVANAARAGGTFVADALTRTPPAPPGTPRRARSSSMN